MPQSVIPVTQIHVIQMPYVMSYQAHMSLHAHALHLLLVMVLNADVSHDHMEYCNPQVEFMKDVFLVHFSRDDDG